MQVHRYDGTVLEVKRDGLGALVGLRLGGKYDAGFYTDSKLGSVFAENLTLVESGGNSGVRVNEKTVVYPDNQPEATSRLILSRFALEDKQIDDGTLMKVTLTGVALVVVIFLVTWTFRWIRARLERQRPLP